MKNAAAYFANLKYNWELNFNINDGSRLGKKLFSDYQLSKSEGWSKLQRSGLAYSHLGSLNGHSAGRISNALQKEGLLYNVLGVRPQDDNRKSQRCYDQELQNAALITGTALEIDCVNPKQLHLVVCLSGKDKLLAKQFKDS